MTTQRTTKMFGLPQQPQFQDKYWFSDFNKMDTSEDEKFRYFDTRTNTWNPPQPDVVQKSQYRRPNSFNSSTTQHKPFWA